MAERGRLKKLLDEAFIKSDDNHGMPNTNQVADYLVANGVILPPCKYGDKIFMIVGDIEAGNAFVDEGKVISVTYEHTGVWIYARYECGLSYHHKFGCGDCFFTREEAEKTLKERKEK